MKKSVKALLASSFVAATLLGTVAPATAAEPRTPNPQMMQGQWGGGQGYGPGMMGGGYGQGYGMQQGGGGGYGPGMMGGGYGQGMMGGSYGMGSGMMGGSYGPMSMLDLTDTQIAQLEKIQTEMMTKQRSLMRHMWEEQEKMGDLYESDKRDPAAIGKAYAKLSDLQRQAVEHRVEMENKVTAILTKEQKAQLRRSYGRGMGMMGW